MSPGPRAVLAVRFGPLDSRRAVIEDGGALRVGRTPPAAFLIPHDRRLSAVHFEIAWRGGTGTLRDLGSTAGTFLGGRRVTEGALQHGDFFRAGDTMFTFHVEGGTKGVENIGGPESEVRRAAALAALAREPLPLFAVLDAARDPRVMALLCVSAEERASLYDGTRGQLLADVAPHLVSLPAGSALLEALVREGWGKSWGVYLTSRRPLAEVRKQLRRVLMVDAEGEAKKLYFRFYDPRVLRVFLPTCSPRQAEEMFSGATSFSMEGERGELLRFSKDDLSGHTA